MYVMQDVERLSFMDTLPQATREAIIIWLSQTAKQTEHFLTPFPYTRSSVDQLHSAISQVARRDSLRLCRALARSASLSYSLLRRSHNASTSAIIDEDLSADHLSRLLTSEKITTLQRGIVCRALISKIREASGLGHVFLHSWVISQLRQKIVLDGLGVAHMMPRDSCTGGYRTEFYVAKYSVTPFFRTDIRFPSIAIKPEGKVVSVRPGVKSGYRINYANGGYASDTKEAREGIVESIDIGVRAKNFEDAYSRSNENMRGIIDHLRSGYSVQTRVIGPVQIRLWRPGLGKYVGDARWDKSRKDWVECERWFPLPAPGWPEQSQLALLSPSIPGTQARFSRAMQKEFERWEPVRWHVSAAMAAWSEDIYRAGSHIWQAIECLLPRDYDCRHRACRRRKAVECRIRHLVSEYYRSTAQRARAFSTKQWKRQYRILSESGRNGYNEWGTLDTATHVFGTARIDTYIRARMREDLGMLFCLRNQVVHEGLRPFSISWASHLAQSGLEVLRMAAKKAADQTA